MVATDTAAIAYPIDPSGSRRAPVLYRKSVLIPRHLQVGRWTVTANLTPRTAVIGEGWRMVFDGGPEPDYGGPVDMIEISIGDDSGTRSTPTITLSGPDDMSVIAEGLAYPDPANVATSQGAQAYDRRSGVGSTVILDYVARNIGHLAISSRAVPGFNTNIVDPVAGSAVAMQARFSPLLEEVVRPAAEQSGLSVRVTATTSGARTLAIAAVVDRTAQARFSIGLGNLKSLKYKKQAPTATVVIGGGRGEETARAFVVQENAVQKAAWRRIESFYDYRNASDVDGGVELTAGTAKQLADSAALEQVDVIPVDTDRLRYGVDYRLGDKVMVEIGAGTGLLLPAVILEAEITTERTRSGRVVRVQPKIGTLGVRTGLRTTQQVADLIMRVGRLERR